MLSYKQFLICSVLLEDGAAPQPSPSASGGGATGPAAQPPPPAPRMVRMPILLSMFAPLNKGDATLERKGR